MFSQAIKFFKPVIVCLLFLLAGKSVFATELITNGAFETTGAGSGWTLQTNGTNQTNSWWNINNSAGANSGSRYQYIGADSNGILAANNVNGLLYQTVTIPAGTTSANLTYYVKITTSESSAAAYDHLYVEIQNSSGSVLAAPKSYSNQSASQFSSWTQQTVNLNSYAGQTIRVAFHGTTNSLTITVFRIDDVSLQVSGATATGSVQVTIAPAGAVSAGAQWQVDGGAFQNSGVTAPGLTVGSHTVAFKPISGWTTPTSHTATVNANQTTQDSGTYVAVQQSTGSLQVTIAPAGAVSAGAQWQVDGGAFQNSGVTAPGLTVGSHTVAFKPISGWTTPTSHTATVNANQTTQDSGTYQAQSSGTFYLSFPVSGYTAYTAPVSSIFDHSMTERYVNDQRVVTFNGEVGDQIDLLESNGAANPSFKKPVGTATSQQAFLVNVLNYQGTTLSGVTTINYDGHPGYDYKFGSGTPVYAAADGWVKTANLVSSDPAGMYIRLQHDAAGYQTQYQHLSEVLVSSSASVTRGQLIGKSGNTGNSTGAHLHFEVKKQVGSLWIAVDPYGWTGTGIDPYVANGNPVSVKLWNDQGSLTAQIITFLPQTSPRTFISGSTFAISPLATASSGLAVTYSSITTGVCTVSGTTVTMVSAGTCTIAADRTAYGNYSAAQQVTRNIVFTLPSTGSLQVNIGPAGAVSAGAQWQVGSGAYQSSGATVPSLSVGSHTVAFKSISGWTAPASHTVTVYANQTTTDSGTYVAVQQSTGSLQVTIAPAGAVSAGAQWQVDGGTLQNSGAIVSGLFVGGHTIAFKPITGWTTPGNRAVMVNANLNTVDSGTYVVVQQSTGSLQVTLAPAGAVSAGAQWQVDGGAFQNSGVAVSGLTVGSHTVAFKPVSGWTTPASYGVTINANQTTTDSGTYQAQSTSACSQYSSYFEEASNTYKVPSNLLRAIAKTESGDNCSQGALNPADGGCGVMQLTNNANGTGTRQFAAARLKVTETALCENSSAGARLNILGGAIVLDSKKCWNNMRVFSDTDFNNCAAGSAPAFTQSELQKLSSTLETWWWSVVAYNGGGLDGSISTSNYPFRVWSKFGALGLTPSYPPLSDIRYLVNGSPLPDKPAKLTAFSTSEIQSGDDLLYPPVSLLAPGSSGGIRWVRGIFDPFVDVVAHNNDGSVYSATVSPPSSEVASLTETTQQASWVYYQTNSGQWYISDSAGVTYLLSGANGYSGEMVWGKIANGNPVATVDYLAKTVHIAPSASAQTSASTYPGVTVAGGRNVNVVSSRGYTAAQQLDGQTLSHAWYFFQVQSTGTWYIVNLNGVTTEVYRLRLKPDNSDYDWLQISNSSWTRSFAATASSMNITLTGR